MSEYENAVDMIYGHIADFKRDIGGYLIPGVCLRKRTGFMGWFYRLIKDKRGWIEIDLQKQLMDAVTKRMEKVESRIT